MKLCAVPVCAQFEKTFKLGFAYNSDLWKRDELARGLRAMKEIIEKWLSKCQALPRVLPAGKENEEGEKTKCAERAGVLR